MCLSERDVILCMRCWQASGGEWSTSLACRQHVPDHADQCSVLHCSRYALFITELLVHSIGRGVCAFLETYVNAEAWWQSILQAHAHSQSDNGSQAAVSGSRSKQHSDRGNARGGSSRSGDENVGQVDNGKTCKRVGVLGVLNRGDKVVDFLRVYLLTRGIIFII